MRIRFLIVFLFILGACRATLSASARQVDTLRQAAIMERYMHQLDTLCRKYRVPASDSGLPVTYSPYYYKMISPALLYRAAIAQCFEIRYALPDSVNVYVSQDTINNETDSILLLDREINDLLCHTYIHHPRLISDTEDEVQQMGTIREDVGTQLGHESALVDQTNLPTFIPDIGDSVVVIPKKPNFWKYYSNSSLQFYQYYNTKNWYKDRTDNYYNMLAALKMGFSYNNKSKFNWETNLEMRLGFRPYPKDTEHQFKTSEDLIRLNSKIGYRATEHWNYTFFVEGTTQMLRSYYDNSDEVRSDFMSPFSSVISLGMEYSMSWKKFSCSANLSPIAYNFKYVARDNLATQHGIKEHHITYNKFGPFINITYNWQIMDNIKWSARIYWFSDLNMNTIEWENTFTFNVNKYVQASLFLYPRFDDSSPNYRSPVNDGFFMFKQWLSLGLNYNI